MYIHMYMDLLLLFCAEYESLTEYIDYNRHEATCEESTLVIYHLSDNPIV